MNNFRIIRFHIDELLIDRSLVSASINKACYQRRPRLRVTGCCKINKTLMLILEEATSSLGKEYLVAPLNATGEDDTAAEIHARYCAGFSTIAGFRIHDEMWGLFSKTVVKQTDKRYNTGLPAATDHRITEISRHKREEN